MSLDVLKNVLLSLNQTILEFLNDVSFLNCINNLDIVGLVETHTTSSFISPLDDYKIFHTHRVQNNRAKRKFGGISVLIRKSLPDDVEPLPVTNASIVWFKQTLKIFWIT
jgi:hypothetical protein